MIGAWHTDDFGTSSGAAYVFACDPQAPAGWSQAARLTAEDGRLLDRFGFSVAISGQTVVVGAPREGYPLGDGLGPRGELWGQLPGDDWGSAYVFERVAFPAVSRQAPVWLQAAKLVGYDGDDSALFDLFGYSVAISGDTVLVGAPEDDNPYGNEGSAYVFERDPADPTRWRRMAKLVAADHASGDHFGWSVALAGATALIGAYIDDDDGPASGSAYVFQRSLSTARTWTQMAKLTASDAEAGDRFGVSVALWGDTALIGAYEDDGGAGQKDAGSAYIFQRDPVDPTVWIETAKLRADDAGGADRFGQTVSIWGDRVLVGGDRYDDLGPSAGAAYLFTRDPLDPGSWRQTRKLTASDGELTDVFGSSVAISAGTLMIGATNDDDLADDAGAVYVYQ